MHCRRRTTPCKCRNLHDHRDAWNCHTRWWWCPGIAFNRFQLTSPLHFRCCVIPLLLREALKLLCAFAPMPDKPLVPAKSNFASPEHHFSHVSRPAFSPGWVEPSHSVIKEPLKILLRLIGLYETNITGTLLVLRFPVAGAALTEVALRLHRCQNDGHRREQDDGGSHCEYGFLSYIL